MVQSHIAIPSSVWSLYSNDPSGAAWDFISARQCVIGRQEDRQVGGQARRQEGKGDQNKLSKI